MYDAKPLLVPILGTFVLALALAAVSPIASVVIFFGGCYGLVIYGHRRERQLRGVEPPQLPQATLLDRDRDVTREPGKR